MKIEQCNSLVFFTLLILSSILQSCVEPIHPIRGLPPGIWRGVIYLDPHKAVKPSLDLRREKGIDVSESNSPYELPFNFEVVYDNDSTYHLNILNGRERIRIDDIQMGRDPSQSKDTFRINFDLYNTHLEGVFQEDIMQGYWVVDYKKNYRLPFSARYSKDYRFYISEEQKAAEAIVIPPKMQVLFESEDGSTYPAIAEFEQDGHHLLGTFRTETGDYRYLEGIVADQNLWLSTFDGTHAFLFGAKMVKDSMQGFFKSGKHYTSTWKAWTSDSYQLTPADEAIQIGSTKDVSVEVRDLNGEQQLIQPVQGRITIYQIMGSWCPNCKDETHFLNDFLTKHSNLPIDVYGLAFERKTAVDAALKQLKRYHERLEMKYPIFLAGLSTSKTETNSKLPFIQDLQSYPTLVIFDKQGTLKKIHSGFDGPATSVYREQTEAFEALMQELNLN